MLVVAGPCTLGLKCPNPRLCHGIWDLRDVREFDWISNKIEFDYTLIRNWLVDNGVDESPLGEPPSDLVHLNIDVYKPLSEDIGIFVGFAFDVFQR